MLVNKIGMSIGECANITGQSGGAHMQWRLSNGYAVNKNQQGIAYRIVGGSGKETSIHSSQGDECRSSKRGTMYQVQIHARPSHSNGACVRKVAKGKEP